jgi:hypothetical protein
MASEDIHSSPRYEIDQDLIGEYNRDLLISSHPGTVSVRVFVEDTPTNNECYLFLVSAMENGKEKKTRLCEHTLPKERYINWLLERKMSNDMVCPKCNQISRAMKKEQQKSIDKLMIEASELVGLTMNSSYRELFYEHVYRTLEFLLAVMRPSPGGGADLSTTASLDSYLSRREISEAVVKLQGNMSLWHQKIMSAKGKAVADKWSTEKGDSGIFYEHTIAAAVYIVAVYQGNRAVADENIGKLKENAKLVAEFWSKDMGYSKSEVERHWGEHLTCTVNYTEQYAGRATRFNVTWEGNMKDSLDIFTELPLSRECLMLGLKFGMYLDQPGYGWPPPFWWFGV